MSVVTFYKSNIYFRILAFHPRWYIVDVGCICGSVCIGGEGWSEGEEQKAKEKPWNTQNKVNQCGAICLSLQCLKNGVYELLLFMIIEGSRSKSSGHF